MRLITVCGIVKSQNTQNLRREGTDIKKQYPPISGQTRLEKFIDMLPSISSFPVFFTWHVGGMFLLPIAIHITQNVLDNSLLLELSIILWLVSEIVLLTLLLLETALQLWEMKHEQEITARVETYVTEHNNCTYDELAIHCMPRKIHVGLESAVQNLISRHKIVRCSEGGTVRLRLPTVEEQLEWYIECGETLIFSELNKLFHCVVPDYDDYLEIEFFLFEKLRCHMGQTPSPDSGPFWLCAEDIPRTSFSSFEDMFSARLFHGASLHDLWPGAVVTQINGEYAETWLHIYDSHCH